MPKKPLTFGDEEASANRIQVPLTTDGEIDWERMRPSQKKQFLSTVESDVTTLEHIGMAFEERKSQMPEGGDLDADLTQGITLENVKAALDGISQGFALAFRMVAPKVLTHPFKRENGKPIPLQIDPVVAAKCFALTPEQHKEIDPRALRLAQNAPMPEWMKKHLDLYLLIGMFCKYQAENAVTAIQTQVKVEFQKAMMVPKQPASRPTDSDKPSGNHEPPQSPVGPSPVPSVAESEKIRPPASESLASEAERSTDLPLGGIGIHLEQGPSEVSAP